MIELVFTQLAFDRLSLALTQGPSEQCAILFSSQVRRNDNHTRLLVSDVWYPTSEDYDAQGELHAQLNPAMVARVTKHARREGLSVTFVHSHPGSEFPNFSTIDDDGEAALRDFLTLRHPTVVHAAMVLSAGGSRARVLGTNVEVRVTSLGPTRRVHFSPDRHSDAVPTLFDRQVRAFGLEGQRLIHGLRVGIVGLGGTGSLVAQQLAHLGVRDFLLIDPDVVEETNLNRINAAAAADIGRAKVEVAASYIYQHSPGAAVTKVQGDVIQARTAMLLVDTDLFFGCTDSHGSRAVLQQVSYQYLTPCIDMGTTIVAKDGRIHSVTGRVQLLAPDHACFSCGRLLDANEVRRDMMSAFERKSDPYIVGDFEPAPAVMSINSTTASLAVTMFLAFFAGLPSSGRHLIYNGLIPSVRSVRVTQNERCFVCSKQGVLARGDSVSLAARRD